MHHQLKKDEEVQKNYEEFHPENTNSWVTLTSPIKNLQDYFNEDLNNFLNNGHSFQEFHNIRQLLIASLEQEFAEKEYPTISNNQQYIDEAIVKIVIKTNQYEVQLDDAVEELVDACFNELKFDFTDRILIYCKEFGEEFAKGNLSSKDNLENAKDKYGVFFSCFNTTFGTNDKEKIQSIVNTLVNKDGIQDIIRSTVNKIVNKLNTFIKAESMFVENEVLRKELQNIKQKVSYKYSLGYSVMISIIVSALTLFIHHQITSHSNYERLIHPGDELIDSNKLPVIDSLSNKIELTIQNLNKIEKDFTELTQQVATFDNQNKQIIEGVTALKEEIIASKIR